jgi:lipid-binding SYLF domain-containing protein
MQRRTFLWGVPGSMIAVSVSLSNCTTTPAGSDTMGEQKDKRRTIDAGVDAGVDSTLTRLHNVVPGARELVGKSNGLLVFPTVINAGIGLGGQYGEGALRVGGTSVGYYSTASASVGLHAGAQ